MIHKFSEGLEIESAQRADMPKPTDINKQCKYCRYWDMNSHGYSGCIQILHTGKRRKTTETGKCLNFEHGKMERASFGYIPQLNSERENT